MPVKAQDEIAKAVLESLAGKGFVLAGGKALIELGLVSRETNDLDIFGNELDKEKFDEAISLIEEALRGKYDIETERLSDFFARLKVSDADNTVEIDLGIDYREYKPKRLLVGEVLDERDAILNKVSALYGRAAARDYYDLYSIRKTNTLSDEEIIAKSKERDSGFVEKYFVEALKGVQKIKYEELREYGVSEDGFREMQKDLLSWAQDIEGASTKEDSPKL